MSQTVDEDEHSIEMHLPYVAKVMERYSTMTSKHTHTHAHLLLMVTDSFCTLLLLHSVVKGNIQLYQYLWGH